MSGMLLYVTEIAPYKRSEKRPDDQRRLAGAHHCLAQSVAAMRQIAELAGLGFAHFDRVAAIPTTQLEAARILSLFTIGETPWNDRQKETITRQLRTGAMGFMPIHAAADACAAWPEYGQLVGARFDGHPWTQEFRMEIVDPNHPATRHLGSTWQLMDEVYLFRNLRPDARVLLRAMACDLDMSAKDARVLDGGIPLAWCFTEQKGRVFYTALGHFAAAYEHPTFLGHLFGGLEWILGDVGSR